MARSGSPTTSAVNLRQKRLPGAQPNALRPILRTFLGLAFAWIGARGALDAAEVSGNVREALWENGRANVLVTLEDTSRPLDDVRARCRAFRLAGDAFLSRFRGGDARPRHRFRFSPVLLLEISGAAELEELDSIPGVVAVEADTEGGGGLRESVPLIGGDRVAELGVDGSGRVVAVLDSGVDREHPDLSDAIVYEYHFLRQGADRGPGASDGHGHGTNVSGIIASRGNLAPRGVAPGSSIVAVKVLDDSNRGWVSDWTAGVEHVVALHEAENGIQVDAINMSLVTDAQFEGVCDTRFSAFSRACHAAQELGIAIFASSGNRGSTSSIAAPACLSAVYSVGSVNDSRPNVVSWFTNRSVLLDLLAPGQTITSTGLNASTSTFSGTSQASPHVAALACLIREAAPELPPANMLNLMRETAEPVSDPLSGLVFPRIDCYGAVNVIVSSDPVFVRGDCALDKIVDISDPVLTLLALFAGYRDEIRCEAACDSDDSGDLNINDAVYTLWFLFLQGPAPVPPYPGCGIDASPDPLTCLAPVCP